jgi:recombination protein RecT
MSVVVTTDRARATKELFELQEVELVKALPEHMQTNKQANRLIRLALTSCRKTPGLYDCTPESLLSCLHQAAALGLEIDDGLGHCYLVPFKDGRTRRLEAQLWIGFKGYRALAFRSGQVLSFPAHTVYSGDTFHFTHGTSARLDFAPALKNRGEVIAVYASISLVGGGFDFEVIGWEEVLRLQQKHGHHKDGRRKEGPWWTHPGEMGSKTAVRRLAKRVPMSSDLGKAAAIDELAEEGLPQKLEFKPEWLYGPKQEGERVPLSTPEQLNAISNLSRQMEHDEFIALVETFGAARPEELTAGRAGELILHLEDLGRQEASHGDQGNEDA